MPDVSPTPLIRPSEDRDITAIAAIYAHHVRFGTASFETEPPSIAEMAARRDAILVKSLPYLVAELDGDLVGYAYAGPYRTRPAYRDTLENSIYIQAERTGRGIGKPLLQTLIRECEARAYRQMIAVVGDSDNLPSIRLHQSCGFRLVGTLDGVGYKLGRWLDSVFLQRTLGPGVTLPPVPR